MYDGGKVIGGLVIFVLFVSLPFWSGALAGQPTGYPGDLPKAKGDSCVLDSAQMLTDHMDLLNQWRDAVVRAGEYRGEDFVVSTEHQDIMYKGKDGKLFKASLTEGCLACHGEMDKFCDRCHLYVGVETYCWDCHLQTTTGGK